MLHLSLFIKDKTKNANLWELRIAKDFYTWYYLKQRPWDLLLYELFLRNFWPTKGFKPFFQQRLSSSQIRAEPEFRLWWMKLFSSNKHYATGPYTMIYYLSSFTINYSTIFAQVVQTFFNYSNMRPETQKCFLFNVRQYFLNGESVFRPCHTHKSMMEPFYM